LLLPIVHWSLFWRISSKHCGKTKSSRASMMNGAMTLAIEVTSGSTRSLLICTWESFWTRLRAQHHWHLQISVNWLILQRHSARSLESKLRASQIASIFRIMRVLQSLLMLWFILQLTTTSISNQRESMSTRMCEYLSRSSVTSNYCLKRFMRFKVASIHQSSVINLV
jgi:hypothetical protein